MPPSLLPISRSRSLIFCLLIAGFELLTYSASDMVMPGMLRVAADLQADVQHVPLALSLYLIGGVCLQWLLGPLSDRVGRRPMMLAAGVLFAVSSALLAVTLSIVQFHLLRVVQGVGLGFVITVGYPALQEAFSEQNALRITALFSNIALLSPLLAPLAGVMLAEWISWRELFWLQAGIAVLFTASLAAFMPETIGVMRSDGSIVMRRPLSPRTVFNSYRRAVSHRHFVACCITIGMMTVPLISWIALSPVLLMHASAWSATAYGLAQLPVFGAFIAGNIILGVLARRHGTVALVRKGTPLVIAGAALGGATLVSPQDGALPVLIAGLSLYAVGLGIVNTALYRMALFAPGIGTGAAAAVLGTTTVLLFACGSMLIAASGAATDAACFGAANAVAVMLALPALWIVLDSAPTSSAGEQS